MSKKTLRDDSSPDVSSTGSYKEDRADAPRPYKKGAKSKDPKKEALMKKRHGSRE